MGKRIFIKNLCHGRRDGYHCNFFHWERSGIGCPCILDEYKDIPDMEKFVHKNEEYEENEVF